MFKKYFIPIFLALANFSTVFSAEINYDGTDDAREFFSYINTLEDSAVVIFPLENRICVLDIVEEAEYCSESEKFICVKSRVLNFYVPRNCLEKYTSWNISGLVFINHGKKNFKYLAKNEEAFEIELRDGKYKYTFFYNYEKGLLGFQGEDVMDTPSKTQMYFLTGNIGFGSKYKEINKIKNP